MIRFFDIIFSGLALLILSPIFMVTSAILRVTGEREIFYRQLRIGIDGKPFKILKFATMLKNSAKMGTGTITIKNDPRVLPVGSFLRRTKINEFPQLFNVLIGDMSLIGPRPQDKRCFAAFKSEHQDIIKKCVPGLSGIGSIFFRNEEDLLGGSENPDYFYDELIMPYKGELEVWFINNRNLIMYFTLIFVTILAVLFPKKINLISIFPSLPKPPSEILTSYN